MKRSLEYTCKRTSANAALELGPGGSGWTKSQFNHTGHRSPGSFGLFHAEPDFYYYLDKDLVLDMTGIAPQIGTTSQTPPASGWLDEWGRLKGGCPGCSVIAS